MTDLAMAAKLAAQELDAADILARTFHRAESMVVLARAARTLEDALDALGKTKAGDPPDEASASGAVAGLDSTEQPSSRALRSAREGLEAAPRLEDEISKEHVQQWQTARKLVGNALRDLRAATRAPRAALPNRLRVKIAVGGAVVLAVGALITARLLRDRFEVVGSDYYGSPDPGSAEKYGPDNAIDGDPETEWLTPHEHDGWLELRYVRPIRVTAVRITNSHNASFNDRAAKQLDVELYRGDQLLQRARTVFDGLEANPQARTIAIAAANVTRVRFVVVSHHGLGGGLTDVEVIEAS